MNKHRIMRAKAAKSKALRAKGEAQAFNQSIWSTVAYRHGNKSFKDHGKYYPERMTDDGGANDDE